MGRGDIALIFQISHNIAYRRGADSDPGLRSQRFRAHRLTVGDIALDECFQHYLSFFTDLAFFYH